MANNKRGGIIYLKVNGELHDAKGNFTYNPGKPKREAIMGSDGKIHGYKETTTIPFIEGEITDRPNLSLDTLLTLDEAVVTLELNNGKVFSLEDAWYAGSGDVQTEEGNINARFEGKKGTEVR